MKIKQHIIKHANERFNERIDSDVSQKDIINYIINGGKIYYAKKYTASRSLVYIPITKEEIYKLILSKKHNKIITFLPWKDIFNISFRLFSEEYENKTYLINLYPDCYRETQSKTSLTQISIINNGIIEKISYNHPHFEPIFNLAWEHYNNIEEKEQLCI